MDFTREPIIETVITPKEGCKLVVRSSKSSAQEEYFVDAVEVVSFGNSFFFRSLERPKSFLVPANDYEILEVREARMVLKNVGLDRSIKIGGGREAALKQPREPVVIEKIESVASVTEDIQEVMESPAETRLDKKRDRRSRYRRRRGREETSGKEGEAIVEVSEEGDKIELQAPLGLDVNEEGVVAAPLTSAPTILSSILPPPPTLISETIARYKDNAMFKGAFFLRDAEKKEGEENEEQSAEEETDEGGPDEEESTLQVHLKQPEFGSFDLSEKEEEDIYRHRTTTFSLENEPLASPYEVQETVEEGSEDVKDHIPNGNHNN